MGPWAEACAAIAKKVYFRMGWAVVFLNEERASFERIVRLVQAMGLERVHEPYIKHLEGSLWEMRLRGKDGIARAIYVATAGRRIVIVRAFAKKTQKTPRREIELALQRAKEIR
jgi:phage-related protein